MKERNVLGSIAGLDPMDDWEMWNTCNLFSKYAPNDWFFELLRWFLQSFCALITKLLKE